MSAREAESGAPSRATFERWCFATACVLCLVPLAVVTFPPGIDLPQHAAQLEAILRFDDPACGFADDLVLNWRSPYLLGYLVALGFGQVLPVLGAIKLTLALSILGVPLAFAVFVRAVRMPFWWSLLGIPLAYSFSFYWGFLVFAFAVPLVLLYLAAVVRYAERPTWRRALAMAAFSIVLFAAHALAAVFGSAVAVAIVWARGGRGWWLSTLWSSPLAAAAPLAWIWSRGVQSQQEGASGTVWSTNSGRGFELFSQVVGEPPTVLGVVVGGLVLATPWLAGARSSRRVLDWLPFYGTVLWCVGAPGTLFSTALVYGRMHVFLPALMLLGIARVDVPGARFARLVRLAPVVLALAWPLMLSVRWTAFEQENAGFGRLLEQAEGGRRALSMVIDTHSTILEGPAYLHFPLWYATRGGCLVEPSFARSFSTLARYRPGRDPGLRHELLAASQPVEASALGRFGYVMARSPEDPRASVLSAESVRLLAREGPWWLFEPVVARHAEDSRGD